MASLDLSSAFDIVNVDLLLKRLLIVGLPNDLNNKIEYSWFNDSFDTFKVNCKKLLL